MRPTNSATENCRRLFHAIVLLCSLLDHHAHVHVERDVETVLAHINPRRALARAF